MDNTDKRIIKVLTALTLMFMGLVVYLTYFQVFQASKIVSSNYNKRLWANEESVLRGAIYDRNGSVLAYSEKTENGQSRFYPFGSLYSHVIGYSYREYGKSGLEDSYNKELLNLYKNPIEEIAQKITGPKEKGNDLSLTIDNSLQDKASKYLSGKKGSIILMNPKTGEVYAMVSKPDFNPATLKEDWGDIVENPDSPFINRSSMGLYTPGSVFKIITATAGLENGLSGNYSCKGSIVIDGYELRDYGGSSHGSVDLKKAMEVSCNSFFANMGLELGADKLRDTAQNYLFNEKIPFDIKTKDSIFPEGGMSKPELGASAIGQGKILVTPLNMLLAASAIANDGNIVKPYLVQKVISPEGSVLREATPEILATATDALTAQTIKDMMVNVVESGTGKNAHIRNVKVAGKTGTAENETGREHAWFVGFAPADNPKVAVVVVLESAGSTGGKSAAPIARDMLINALNRIP